MILRTRTNANANGHCSHLTASTKHSKTTKAAASTLDGISSGALAARPFCPTPDRINTDLDICFSVHALKVIQLEFPIAQWLHTCTHAHIFKAISFPCIVSDLGELISQICVEATYNRGISVSSFELCGRGRTLPRKSGICNFSLK